MESNAKPSASGAHEGAHHGPGHYLKIWGILLVLLLVSIVGPTVGIRAVTLLTAFGVAVVKAWLVASEFMHLKYEKKYISYMLLSMVFFMLIFYYGVAPDVMTKGGQNWERIPVSFNLPSVEHSQGESKAH